MAPNTTRKRIRLTIAADDNSEVYVAGTFNDWDPRMIRLTGEKGIYSTTLLLPKGRHQYKFIVNGTWCTDPACRDWAHNYLGSLNSVLEVA